MSLSSQASGYMSSSSSSLQTAASSSSLTGASHPAHTHAHHHRAADGHDGWEDDPLVASDPGEAGEWRAGVHLRHGWEFLETDAAAAVASDAAAKDLAASANRLSLAETVKAANPAAHRSSRSSADRLSQFVEAPPAAASSTAVVSGVSAHGRTSRAPSVSAGAGRPAHIEASTPAREGSPAPSSHATAAAAAAGKPSFRLAAAAPGAGQRRLPALPPPALGLGERSASPALCASIDAWAAAVPPSPSGRPHTQLSSAAAVAAAAASSSSSRREKHRRSIDPPPPERGTTRRSSGETAGAHAGHRRAMSTQPLPTRGDEPAQAAGAPTPARPFKPRWLQASPSFSSPNLSAQVPDSPKGAAPGKRETHTPKSLEVSLSALTGGGGEKRRMAPPPKSFGEAGRTPPLQTAPLLPPRPGAGVQKQAAEAEFAPALSHKSAPPPAPAWASTSGSSRGFATSNGLKGRLAAFGGMVGGAATHLYQEGSQQLAASSSSLANLASGAGAGAGSAAYNPLSYSAYAPSQAAPRSGQPPPPPPPPPTTTTKQRGFQHAILSAPSSGVKMFNTAWKGKASSAAPGAGSSSNGPPAVLLDRIDGDAPTPIMFNPSATVAAGCDGRVFGRDVVQVARQWGVREGVAKKRSGSVDEACIDGSSIDRVSREALPALVVRCVEYLEIWAPREEGIFRISGRSTHINKLRAQLDTGADIDLKLSDAGELDPHAVASVFKAYLRELPPSSILTPALQPSFDAVMERFTGSSARGGEFAALPYLKTVQEKTASAGERTAQLKRDIKELLSMLPVACWALLKVVVGLLQHTDRHSKENKMGIPNLLLVLCPSICLSPPFLRLLIEHSADLFDTPPQKEHPPAPAPLPPLSPRPALSTPARGQARELSTGGAPELDMPRTFPSPLPDFSLTESSPRPADDGWGPQPVSPELIALPLSPAGSPKRRKPTALPPVECERSDASDGASSASAAAGPALLEQPSTLRTRKRSIIDLASAAFGSSSSSSLDKERTRSVASSLSTLAPSGGPPSPADQPVEDVLPPAGIVAAKKHMFSFRSDKSKSSKASSSAAAAGAPAGGEAASAGAGAGGEDSSPQSASSVRTFRRPGHGMFTSSSSRSGKPSSASGSGHNNAHDRPSEHGKKPTLWSRGHAAASGAQDAEGTAGKTVRAAVKAFEPKQSSSTERREKALGPSSAP